MKVIRKKGKINIPKDIPKWLHNKASIEEIKKTFNDSDLFLLIGKHIAVCSHPNCKMIREILDKEECLPDHVLEKIISSKERKVYIGHLSILKIEKKYNF